MVKNQIIVSSVVSQGLGVRATAKKYGVSPAWVSTLVSRYRCEGPTAFEPRSKRPHANLRECRSVFDSVHLVRLECFRMPPRQRDSRPSADKWTQE